MKRKLISALLLTALVLTMAQLAPSAQAAPNLKDISTHWGKSYIDSAVARGYVSGYEDGTFKPNNSITRAEFCKMLNSALGLTATTTINFTDVASSKWYYADVQKAVSAGYISGYDNGTFGGDNKITRQEAAVVISRLVTAASSSKDITQLRDSTSIASWALDGAKTVYSKDYMSGDNLKRFNPTGNLTRAEAVKIIETLIGQEKVTKTNLTVSQSGQTYSNTVFVGSVIISSDIGEGNVTFDNCRVLGTMLVNGGGTSAIRLSNTRVSNMTVNSASTTVGVACAGSSTVSNVYVSTPCALAEGSLTSGGQGFTDVTLGGANLNGKTVTLTGDFGNVSLTARSGLHLSSGTIANLTVNSAAASSVIDLASSGTIQKAVINASCSFTGAGKIQAASQNAKDVTYSNKPLSLTDPNGSTSTRFSMDVYPANGDKNIPLGDAITLMFSDTVTNADGGAINAAYIQNVVELHRDSTNGTKITYLPTLSANNRAISIQPIQPLQDNTAYYLTVSAGAFRSSSGQLTDAVTVRFSTGNDEDPLVPAVTPADGSDVIPVTVQPTLRFSGTIYNENGKALTGSYVESDVIELRRDKQTGTKVSFDATVSSDKKTITITPDDYLDTDTTYYIILLADSVSDGDDTNSKQVFSFTTSEEAYVVPLAEPSSGSGEIDANQTFTFTFDDPLTQPDGSTLKASYIESDVLTLRKNSAKGTTVSVSAKISSDKKTITVTPDKALSSDTDYFIVFEQGSVIDSNNDEIPELVFSYTTGPTSTGSGLVPATSPADGKSGVSTSSKITLTYGQSILDAGGKDITADYLSSVISLRKNSSSGTKVSFKASINSAAKVITITPSSKLTNNTKYYVTVSPNAFKNTTGTKTAQYSFSFTVGKSTSFEPYSTYPEDGDTGIGVSPIISIDFDEAVYQKSGSALTSTYLKNSVIELRRDKVTGTKIAVTASINKNKDSISVSPSSDLAAGTKYYVIINGDTLSNEDGDLMDEFTFSFTTKSGATASATLSSPTMVPANGETTAEVTTNQIQLIYPDALKDSENKALTAKYLESYFKVTEKTTSGDEIPFTAKIASGNKVITLELAEDLKCDTKYYVTLPAGILRSGSSTSKALSYSFTTKKPTVEITELVPDKLSAEVTVSFDYTGAETADFTITVGSKTVVSGFTPKTGAKATYTWTVDELKENTSYTVKVTLNYDGKSVSTSKSTKTLATSTQSTLKTVTVSDANGSYRATLTSPSKNKATAKISGDIEPQNGSVTVKVVPSSDKSTVEIDGVETTTANITVEPDATEKTVIITVTAEDGKTATEYTLTIPIAQ